MVSKSAEKDEQAHRSLPGVTGQGYTGFVNRELAARVTGRYPYGRDGKRAGGTGQDAPPKDGKASG